MTGKLGLAERLLRRHDRITIGGLVLLTVLAWGYVLAGAGTGMSPFAMTTWSFPPTAGSGEVTPWSAGHWLVMAAMWWVMMIAMMTPSAASMVLLHGRVLRRARQRGRPAGAATHTALFVGGYLAAWLAFSLAATAAQWLLEQAGLVHQMLMWSTSETLSGLLLIAAGLYQLTPLKSACLANCRAPADYLARAWRPGRTGAFMMGAHHGAYCLGCCWLLMALLFVGGAMNLIWIVGLAAVVLVEKLSPFGAAFARAMAAVMVAAGGWLLLG